jgi:hypothetical protein
VTISRPKTTPTQDADVEAVIADAAIDDELAIETVAKILGVAPDAVRELVLVARNDEYDLPPAVAP